MDFISLQSVNSTRPPQQFANVLIPGVGHFKLLSFPGGRAFTWPRDDLGTFHTLVVLALFVEENEDFNLYLTIIHERALDMRRSAELAIIISYPTTASEAPKEIPQNRLQSWRKRRARLTC